MGLYMSAQILELLFFAGIAFLIINKLISALGTTSDDDPAKRRSYFGEPTNGLKDVTSTSRNNDNVIKGKFLEQKSKPQLDLTGLIAPENIENIRAGIFKIQQRLPSFNPSNFLRNAKIAFKMIIEAATNNKDNLAALVDKRYLEQFSVLAPTYSKLLNVVDLEAKISEIYMFGNNAFIKILFISNINHWREEWTFSRSLISSSSDWYLTNIDRI